MVDDEILGADGGENVPVMLQDALGKTRRVGLEFERRQIGLDQLRKVRDPDQPAAFRDQCRIRPSPFAHQRLDVGGRIVVEFDPDDPPAPSPLDRRAEISHQILGLIVDLDVAVAKDTERAVSDLGEAGEQLIEMGDDRRFDGNEADRLAETGKRDEARQGRRDHQQFGEMLALSPACQAEHQAEPAIGDERKRVRRVDRLGSQHRQYLFTEMVRQPASLTRCQRIGGDHLQPVFGQGLAQQYPLRLLCHHQRIGLGADRVELLGRGATVDRQILDSAQLLPFQAGDAGREEFVDVRSGDGQEAQSLKQRMRHVGRLLQHPAVECQPRQFAVEITIGGGVQRGHAALRWSMIPASPSARRMVGSVSRARSAKAWRSIASTTRSAVT